MIRVSEGRGFQQDTRESKRLNSGDCFIVVAPEVNKRFLWKGKGASEAEKDLAFQIYGWMVNYVEDGDTFKEGFEPELFWQALGGKDDYSKMKEQIHDIAGFEPRLFNISNRSGYSHMKEVPNYTQQDLLGDDCYILDVYTTMYIWIGPDSNKFERNASHKKAAQYIESIVDGRDKAKCAVVEINSGSEPPFFQVQFPNWSEDYTKNFLSGDAFKKLKEQHATPEGAFKGFKKAGEAGAEAEGDAAQEETKEEELDPNNPYAPYDHPDVRRYAYEELKSIFPPRVKPDKKEDYLTDEEFEKIFKCTRETWFTWKLWK